MFQWQIYKFLLYYVNSPTSLKKNFLPITVQYVLVNYIIRNYVHFLSYKTHSLLCIRAVFLSMSWNQSLKLGNNWWGYSNSYACSQHHFLQLKVLSVVWLSVIKQLWAASTGKIQTTFQIWDLLLQEYNHHLLCRRDIIIRRAMTYIKLIRPWVRVRSFGIVTLGKLRGT